ALATLPFLPEWYLALAGLAIVAGLGSLWRPLLLALPLLVFALGATLVDAALAVPRSARRRRRPTETAFLWCLTACLFVLQPPSRLLGRIRGGLTPWRKRGAGRHALPMPRTMTVWRERPRPPEETIRALERSARRLGSAVLAG